MKTATLSVIIMSMVLSLYASENPKTKIEADKQTGYLPLTVKFKPSEVANPNVVYRWDFGNGNFSTLKTPSAMFVNPGTYQVKLMMSNGSQTDSSTVTINVLPNPELINNLYRARAGAEE